MQRNDWKRFQKLEFRQVIVSKGPFSKFLHTNFSIGLLRVRLSDSAWSPDSITNLENLSCLAEGLSLSFIKAMLELL